MQDIILYSTPICMYHTKYATARYTNIHVPYRICDYLDNMNVKGDVRLYERSINTINHRILQPPIIITNIFSLQIIIIHTIDASYFLTVSTVLIAL